MIDYDFQVWKKSRLVHLCLAITFFTSGVIVNFIQGILYFTLRHVHVVLYRKINWYLCATIYAQLVCLGDWWSGSKIIFYIDRDEFDKYYGKEHAYCIMNHKYEVDWLIGWMITDRIHLLGLLLFPEGTRFTPKKHEASLEFAEKHNLPLLKHHLLPRTRGFIASLPSMKGKIPAVYDIQIAFKDDAPHKPTITNMLFGKPLEAHIYMSRMPMEDLPEDVAGQEKFLRDLFVKKDKLMESFAKTGDFFTISGIPRLEPFQLERRLHLVINFLFWNIFTLVPIGYYLVKLLFSGELLYLSIGLSIIGAFFLLLNKTIGMSEIKKGSSYGTTSTPDKSD